MVQVDGTEAVVTATASRLRIHLRDDNKMAPPVLLIDRVATSQSFQGSNDNAASNSPAK